MGVAGWSKHSTVFWSSTVYHSTISPYPITAAGLEPVDYPDLPVSILLPWLDLSFFLPQMLPLFPCQCQINFLLFCFLTCHFFPCSNLINMFLVLKSHLLLVSGYFILGCRFKPMEETTRIIVSIGCGTFLLSACWFDLDSWSNDWGRLRCRGRR